MSGLDKDRFSNKTVSFRMSPDRVDMKRANETREITKKIGAIAERTGCAVILIGHMNKELIGLLQLEGIPMSRETLVKSKERFNIFKLCN